MALWFRASESRPIKVSQPFEYTIITPHIIGIDSYVCVFYSNTRLPHGVLPGNRQYTPRESVANEKQEVSHSLNKKENSRLLAYGKTSKKVVDQRSHW